MASPTGGARQFRRDSGGSEGHRSRGPRGSPQAARGRAVPPPAPGSPQGAAASPWHRTDARTHRHRSSFPLQGWSRGFACSPCTFSRAPPGTSSIPSRPLHTPKQPCTGEPPSPRPTPTHKALPGDAQQGSCSPSPHGTPLPALPALPAPPLFTGSGAPSSRCSAGSCAPRASASSTA